MTSQRKTRTAGPSGAGQSKLEQLHDEAKAVLDQKAQEITQFNSAIQEAEAELAQLQADLEKQSQLLSQLQQPQSGPSGDAAANSDLIDDIRAEQQAEIDRAEQRHRRHIAKLQNDIKRSIQASEDWCDRHAGVVLATKTAQLEVLRRQLGEAKTASHRASLTATQSRTNLFQESKNTTIMNSKHCQLLESQIGELTAVAREELREVQAKIDECLLAVDIRERDHRHEVERYEIEMAEREQQYAAHLEVAAQECESKKQRLEKEVAAAESKANNLQRILKQLEKQNGRQLQSLLHDVEKMKSVIYESRSRETERQNETRSYIATVNQLQRECAQSEQELGLIEAEMKELLEENRDLKLELQKLDRTLNGAVRNY